MDNLEAVLTANIKDLERKLKRAESGLSKYGKIAQRENSKVNTSFKKAGKGASNANPALQDFGRVIQDMPYGIRGVGNNIDQLFSSFNYLSQSAGGSKKALAAMVSGLTGPAGIAIALSSVIAIATSLSASGITLTDVLETLSGGLDQAAKAQRNFNKEAAEGVGQAQAEGVKLQALVKVAKDLSQSTQTRARAIAEINEEYGKYLPAITKENVNTLKVTKAIDKYNESLIRKAKITAAQSLISKEFSKILELQQKDFISSASALDFLVAGLKTYGNQSNVVGEIASQGFQRQQKEITEAEKRLTSLRGVLQKLLTEDLQVGGIATGSGDGIARPLLQQVETIQRGITASLANVTSGMREQITGQLPTIQKDYESFVVGIVDLTGTLRNGISNGFATIGQAIATGGNFIGAVGQAVLQTMGSIVTQLGQASIAAGVAALALKQLFKSPAAAIAAGAALVTIGSALSSARGSVGSIGSGSVGGQGSSSFSGSNSFGFSGSSGGSGTVVFKIHGRELIGVLNNNLSANQRLGGSVNVG